MLLHANKYWTTVASFRHLPPPQERLGTPQPEASTVVQERLNVLLLTPVGVLTGQSVGSVSGNKEIRNNEKDQHQLKKKIVSIYNIPSAAGKTPIVPSTYQAGCLKKESINPSIGEMRRTKQQK